jgi:DNA gyrase subunit A
MVSLLLVDDNDELMMVTDKGKLIRTSIKGINVISRNTQGVRLINLSAGETLIGIARLPEEEKTDEDSIIDPEDFPEDEESIDETDDTDS